MEPRRLILVAVLLALLVVLSTWPQVLQLSTGVNDFGDPLLNSWALAWVAHVIPLHPSDLFNANILYPERNTLTYSETLILPGLLVAPIMWLGGDPILAHNVLLLAGYVLSGLTMFVLVRSLTEQEEAALVAAVVFALFPYRLEQYAHVQLQLTWWLPLTLWALHRLSKHPSGIRAVQLGLFLAAQFYSCVYLTVEGCVAVTVVGLAAISAAQDRRRSMIRALALGVLVGGVLAFPLARAYMRASAVVGVRSLSGVAPGSATPADYFHPNAQNALYGDPSQPGVAERQLFPGFVSPTLALISMIPPAGPIVWTYVACALVVFDLSLGTHTPVYHWFYEWFPPARAMRVPARFGLVFGLALSVLAGLGMARLRRGRSRRMQTILATAVIAAMTLESRPRSLELSALPDPRPVVYAWLANQPPGVVCEYPVGQLEGRAGPQDAT